LHDRIIAAIASEADGAVDVMIRRGVAIGGRRAGNPLNGQGGNDVGRTARTG